MLTATFGHRGAETTRLISLLPYSSAETLREMSAQGKGTWLGASTGTLGARHGRTVGAAVTG